MSDDLGEFIDSESVIGFGQLLSKVAPIERMSEQFVEYSGLCHRWHTRSQLNWLSTYREAVLDNNPISGRENGLSVRDYCAIPIPIDDPSTMAQEMTITPVGAS